MKSQTCILHKRFCENRFSPSQTSWLNGTRNNELFLDMRNANISTYSAGTNIDGGNSGTDTWIEFGLQKKV
jgi:hypothetical protein